MHRILGNRAALSFCVLKTNNKILHVVASCGNTDSTATKVGVNKALEQNNFVLKMNQNNSDWTD